MPDQLAVQGPEISDYIAIQALVAAYSDAVNRRDAADWANCWADNAIWRLRELELSGKDQIVAGWRRAMSSYTHVWFMAFIGHIELSGAEASLRTHTFEYLCPADGQPKLQSGLYLDRVIQQNGRWVFASRTFTSQELPL